MCSGLISRRDFHAAIRKTSRTRTRAHRVFLREEKNPHKFCVSFRNGIGRTKKYIPTVAECKPSKREKYPTNTVRKQSELLSVYNLQVPGPVGSDFIFFFLTKYFNDTAVHIALYTPGYFSTCTHGYFARQKLKTVKPFPGQTLPRNRTRARPSII